MGKQFCSYAFVRLEESPVPVAISTRQKTGIGSGVTMKWMRKVKKAKRLFPKKRQVSETVWLQDLINVNNLYFDTCR